MTKEHYNVAELITTGWTYEGNHICRGNLNVSAMAKVDDEPLAREIIPFENLIRSRIYNYIFQEVAKDIDELRHLFVRQMVGYADSREQYELHVMLYEKLKEMQNKLNWNGELDNETNTTE